MAKELKYRDLLGAVQAQMNNLRALPVKDGGKIELFTMHLPPASGAVVGC
jgi:hypothetical protein